MGEMRRTPVTLQCAWCERIQAGAGWIPERRSLAGTRYSHSICDHCLENQMDEVQNLPIISHRHLDV